MRCKRHERRRRRRRKNGGREWMSGTMPACRSSMKNDVCGCGGRLRFCISHTHTHAETGRGRGGEKEREGEKHTPLIRFNKEGYITVLLKKKTTLSSLV